MALCILGALTAGAGILIASQIGSGTGGHRHMDATERKCRRAQWWHGAVWRQGGAFGVLFPGRISNGMTLLSIRKYWQ